MAMEVQLQDVLVMKKPHPCGSRQWLVLRSGMTFVSGAWAAATRVMLPRSKAEKNIRQILRDGTPVPLK